DDQILGRDGSRFASDESHVLFLMKAARRFGRVTFLGRVAPQLEARHHALPAHFGVSALPFYPDVATLCTRFHRYAPRLVRQLRRAIRGADVLWLVWPHPISLLSIILLR